MPIVINKKLKATIKNMLHQSMINFEKSLEFHHEIDNIKHSSEYYDTEILRSSVIVPETVFVERLDDRSKLKVNNLLNFYKVFS